MFDKKEMEGREKTKYRIQKTKFKFGGLNHWIA